jgi:hypothetical protein
MSQLAKHNSRRIHDGVMAVGRYQRSNFDTAHYFVNGGKLAKEIAGRGGIHREIIPRKAQQKNVGEGI